jgi:glycosyltransferase involved in cell wall biosynthesis
MDKWLRKNLQTYISPYLRENIEVLCLNNASEDHSKEIIQEYCDKDPLLFTLLDRDNRGYGSSINEALAMASGRYFRIVDADDWVNTEELERQVRRLETLSADVVLTDYCIVNMQNGKHTPVRAGDAGVAYDVLYSDLDACKKTLPSIHATTYRTLLLRDMGFFMQDKMYFVDEEYVILPYIFVGTSIFLNCDIYRYQVANPEQSMSPKNRAKYQDNRGKVLKRLILEFQKAASQPPSADALEYCRLRISKGVGDHFTTLYMYVENRTEGRYLAGIWKEYLKENAPEFWTSSRKKAWILGFANRLHISLPAYEKLKGAFTK